MYIWIGCKLPEEFETYIRAVCVPMSEKLGLDISGFSLPQHISLKISFEAGEQADEILAFLKERLSRERKFYVNPRTPKRQGNILWIPFRPNPPLQHLHNMLDRELKTRFGIPQHEFDKAFFFHSTLCLGPEDRLAEAEALLRDLPLPTSLAIDTILLGVSENKTFDTCRIVGEINL